MNSLPENEDYYRLLFEVSPLPALVYDLQDFSILDVNAVAIENYGYSREEFVAASMELVHSASDFQRLKTDLAHNSMRSREKEIWQHRKKNGESIPVEINAYTIRMAGRLVRLVICKDVTEWLHSETRLREAQEYYRLLFEHSPFPVFVYDRETLQFLDANDAAIHNYGYSREELLCLTIKDIRPEEEAPRLLKLLEEHPPAYRVDDRWRHRRKDGSVFEVDVNWFPITFNSRDAYVAVAQDITDRRRAENALRESEQQYRELYEKAQDIIYTHDLEGNLIWMNEAGKRILNCPESEWPKTNILSFLSPETAQYVRQMIARKLSGDTKYTIYELEVTGKNGKVVPVELSTNLIYKNGKPMGVQGIARDLTKRRQLEEQLRRAQKMEAVGRLSSGVAHDFNNRLTAIMGYTSLLLRRTEENTPAHYYLDQIRVASERAADLTRDLLAFSRKQIMEPKTVYLNELVSDWGNLIRVMLGEAVDINLILGADVGMVKVDPSQLEHVIMNLAINALDAMPKGGAFTLETIDIEISELQGRINSAIPPGRYARLMVRDTGAGMSDETLARLFEPFFTTKEKGKGTGLGLFTVYGIVQQSGGHIEVKSALGEGTSFFIYFPIVEDSEQVVSGLDNILATASIAETTAAIGKQVKEILTGLENNLSGEEQLVLQPLSSSAS